MSEIGEHFEKSAGSPHDAAFKAAFQKRELAKAFFRRCLPEKIVRQIDFRYLKLALAWALKVTPNLDFKKNCPNNFVAMLPDLKKMEPSKAFKSKISLRKDEEIISHCDFVYCLHWAIRQTELEGKKIPFKILPFVVPERRKALDWIISKDDWYEVSLDT